MEGRMWKLVTCLVLLTGPSLQLVSSKELELTMPSVQPKENDTYLCHSKKIDNQLYVTGFKPKASMAVAHHMLIYVCAEPGGSDETWDCGEMHRTGAGEYKTGPVCKDGGRIIYAWAMDAPKLTLPKDVAFKIGGSADKHYLVIQVHYKDVTRFLPPSSERDSSGVVLTTTTKKRPKTAGVYLIAANGVVGPHSVTYMEAACTFQEPLTLSPFAFRVHTHKLGKVVSGYKVRDGEWTEIGRRNPQKPQMFYPVQDNSLKISQGDTLAARCTMQNDGGETVSIGPTSDDEMCNFYIMYSVKGDEEIKNPICMSPGPPEWNWNSFEGINAGKAPTQASVDPETSDWFKETEKHLNDVQDNLKRETEDVQKQFKESLRRLMGSNKPFSNYDYQNLFDPSQQVEEPQRNVISNYDEPVDYSFGNGNDYYQNENQFQINQQPEVSVNELPMQIKTHKVSFSENKPRMAEFKLSDFEPAEDDNTIARFYSPVETKIIEGPITSRVIGRFRFPKPPPKESESVKEMPAGSAFEASNFQFPDIKMPAMPSFEFPDIKIPAMPSFEFPKIPTIPPIQTIPTIKPLNFKMPEIPTIPSINIPDLPKIELPVMPNFPEAPAIPAGNSDPTVSETFRVFDDNNGGKGFEHHKSQESSHSYNEPGRSGHSQVSSHSSSSRYYKVSQV